MYNVIGANCMQNCNWYPWGFSILVIFEHLPNKYLIYFDYKKYKYICFHIFYHTVYFLFCCTHKIKVCTVTLLCCNYNFNLFLILWFFHQWTITHKVLIWRQIIVFKNRTVWNILTTKFIFTEVDQWTLLHLNWKYCPLIGWEPVTWRASFLTVALLRVNWSPVEM